MGAMAPERATALFFELFSGLPVVGASREGLRTSRPLRLGAGTAALVFVVDPHDA